MPTATYEKISAVNLTTTAASIEFTSIPQTYTDLRLVLCSKLTGNNDSIYLQFNGNSSAVYDQIIFYGTGSTPLGSVKNSNGTYMGFPQAWGARDYPFIITGDIMNYSSSSFQKTLLATGGTVNGTTRGLSIEIGLWKNTAAITSIFMAGFSYSFTANTKCTLYGIKKA